MRQLQQRLLSVDKEQAKPMIKRASDTMSLRVLLRCFVKSERGNFAIIFSLAAVPIIFLIGMALDFSQAMKRKAQLDAAADSAAITAVAPALMSQTSAQASAAATAMFNAKAKSIAGINFAPANLKISVQDSGLTRTASVVWTASVSNNFPSVLGQQNWSIGGNSSSSSSSMPNINFYLLLDDSPSMAIAGSPSGIQTMVNATPQQGGCAFACHETNPAADNLGNPGGVDNYTLARQLGVVLRIDLLKQATQSLMSTAQNTANGNNVTYGAAIYTFDYQVNTLQPLTTNLTTAASSANNIQVLTVAQNQWLTPSYPNWDEDTDLNNALSSINSTMPTPGNGTNSAGDKPQQVLFFVTDGLADYYNPSCLYPVGGGRCQEPVNVSYCTAIKNRGIRIAVLYTEYLPLPTNGYYNATIAPWQSQIGANMQQCASTGLYFDVQSGGDISAAMNALFSKVVATARLTQ